MRWATCATCRESQHMTQPTGASPSAPMIAPHGSWASPEVAAAFRTWRQSEDIRCYAAGLEPERR